MGDKAAARPKVLVAYDFLPHYRLPVMRRLAESAKFDFRFVASDKSLRGGIRQVVRGELPKFFPCRSFIIGPFLIQPWLPLVALTYRYRAFVFLGNPYFLTTWAAAAMARLRGKKVLFWTHGWIGRERGAKRWIRAAYYRLAHKLLLYGHAAKEEGLRNGFQCDELAVIYNSLDYDAQRALAERLTEDKIERIRLELFGDTNPVAVCSARLTANCKLELLLDALALLARNSHPVNALLIGDGPERKALEARAHQLGIKAVFVGACYDEQRLSELVGSANVTVSPGKIGLTGIQSLAFGIPVISHDRLDAQMPEVEAIQPGTNGELFQHGSVPALAEAICRWTPCKFVAPAVRIRCIEGLVGRYTPAAQMELIEAQLHSLGV